MALDKVREELENYVFLKKRNEAAFVQLQKEKDMLNEEFFKLNRKLIKFQKDLRVRFEPLEITVKRATLFSLSRTVDCRMSKNIAETARYQNRINELKKSEESLWKDPRVCLEDEDGLESFE